MAFFCMRGELRDPLPARVMFRPLRRASAASRRAVATRPLTGTYGGRFGRLRRGLLRLRCDSARPGSEALRRGLIISLPVLRSRSPGDGAGMASWCWASRSCLPRDPLGHRDPRTRSRSRTSRRPTIRGNRAGSRAVRSRCRGRPVRASPGRVPPDRVRLRRSGGLVPVRVCARAGNGLPTRKIPARALRHEQSSVGRMPGSGIQSMCPTSLYY
jgi:hypothetical protein